MVDRLIPDLTTRNIRRLGDSARRLQQEIHGWDVPIREDDFLTYKDVAEMITFYPAIKTGTDGSFDALITGIGGEATLDVGDGATSGDDEYGGQALTDLQWKGDLNAFFICRLKISDITNVKVEMGFTDSIADAGAIDVLATPTKTADECAVWIIDKDDGAGWQNATVLAGGTPQKDESSSIVAPVNGVYQTLGVFLEGGQAMFMQWDKDGRRIGETQVIDAALDGSVPLCPWLFVQNRANTIDRLITVDNYMVGQRRT